jgi:hypothetical protein
MEGKTDQRGQDIPTGVSMTTTNFSEKILTARLKFQKKYSLLD